MRQIVLTLEIGGDLFRQGGIVILYPVVTDVGAETDAAGEPEPLGLKARFTQVQLPYPTGGSKVLAPVPPRQDRRRPALRPRP